MQKVLTINLGGIIFQIEDDAYDLLKKYIESIRQHFKNSAEGLEISNDIEYRLAEMLQEKLINGKNLINKVDIEQIIAIMGQPKDFQYEEGATSGFPNTPPVETKRKFFRDPDNKMLGGVCAGISAYLGIEQVWIIRLILLASLFLFSVGFWIYVLLWILVPKAKTTADKLSMKGETATIENIVKNIEDNYKNLNSSSFYGIIKRFGVLIENIIKMIIKVFSKVFGVVLLFIFAILFIVFMVVMSFKNENLSVGDANLADVYNILLPATVNPGLIFGVFAVLVGIPLIYLFIVSIKLLGSKFRINGFVHITAMALMVLASLFGVYLGLKTLEEFASESQSEQVLKIDVKETTLNIVPYSSNPPAGNSFFKLEGNKSGMVINDSGLYIKNVKLILEKSKTDDVELVYTVSSHGANKQEAQKYQKDIIYKFSKVDDNLLLDPYFFIPKGNKWRLQNVQITLRLPIGKEVKLDNFINQFDLEVNDKDFDYSEKDLDGKTLLMTEEGFECLMCSNIRHIPSPPDPPLPPDEEDDDNNDD